MSLHFYTKVAPLAMGQKIESLGTRVAPRPQAFYYHFQLEMGPGKPNQAKNNHKMRGAEAPNILSLFAA